MTLTLPDGRRVPLEGRIAEALEALMRPEVELQLRNRKDGMRVQLSWPRGGAPPVLEVTFWSR